MWLFKYNWIWSLFNNLVDTYMYLLWIVPHKSLKYQSFVLFAYVAQNDSIPNRFSENLSFCLFIKAFFDNKIMSGKCSYIILLRLFFTKQKI